MEDAAGPGEEPRHALLPNQKGYIMSPEDDDTSSILGKTPKLKLFCIILPHLMVIRAVWYGLKLKSQYFKININIHIYLSVK